jgi:hypothetical protein
MVRLVRQGSSKPRTRALVEVLLLHRHLSHTDVGTGLSVAVATGAATADVAAERSARPAAQCGRRGAGDPRQTPSLPSRP